ncbi:MAG: MoxR family ATPase, partial [Bacteroidaceae bacterium]|nr:MoxR family ATPase [Bacteroidaceae bacterium]
YPSIEEERMVVDNHIKGKSQEVKPMVGVKDILEAREVVKQIYVSEEIEKYITDIVFATRYPDRYNMPDMKQNISFGGSPRASINLALAARAYAFLKHRGYVIPDDVRAMAHDVLRHRIGLTYEAEANNITADDIINQILENVKIS